MSNVELCTLIILGITVISLVYAQLSPNSVHDSPHGPADDFELLANDADSLKDPALI